ncbi:uncharacterized protein LOC111251499 isoform X1 [Varroa destructor]|uniref:Uncharacterized protein n=1 Tax=Varroa destructor TaxID=109461 RepID=A0A7M7KCV0_VARDE|nr:uncharacterized protein LOC111251499 isoform X1 [Varroa destructor]
MEEEHNGQQYQGLHNMGTRLVYVPSDVPVPQHLKDPSAAEDAEREARGVAIDLSRKSNEEAINEWKLREDLIINDLTTRMDQPIELEVPKPQHLPDVEPCVDPATSDTNLQLREQPQLGKRITSEEISTSVKRSDAISASFPVRDSLLEKKQSDPRVFAANTHHVLSPATDNPLDYSFKPRKQQLEVAEEPPRIVSDVVLPVGVDNEPTDDPILRLHNMLKPHHQVRAIPSSVLQHDDDEFKDSIGPRKTPADTRRYQKNVLSSRDRRLETQLSEGQEHPQRSTRNTGYRRKNKKMLGADEFYLTELDGVSTDPAQPPIIRSSQSNSATLSKSTHSSSSTDKKVNFNLEENMTTQCVAARPQNNFYGKPNQKRKQELRNIAYTSRSERAKKEGALDFDPKEKAGMSARKMSRRSTHARRASIGKQGSRTRRIIEGKSNVIITTGSLEDPTAVTTRIADNSDTNEFSQMLTKATNSCKMN